MRLLNSLKNISTVLLQNIITILINFIARTIFIKTLGTEYLGLNSLFTSIVSMLSIAELGIASAIVVNMYKPIAEGDNETVKALMKFYKICYRVIACIVFILGVCFLPFIHFFMTTHSIHESIYLIYILFLSDTTLSYLFTYKRSIFYVNQKNYVVNFMDLFYTILMNIGQVFVLLSTGNYIYYLLVKVGSRLIENSVINFIGNMKYPILMEKRVKRLEREVKNDIIQKVKGLLFHRIGEFIVLGTDSIIISKFIGLTILGMYTNYTMIVNTVLSMLTQIIIGTTASIGNLLTENNPDKSFDVYKKLNFINFWLFSIATISIYLIIEPFITMWIGANYLLSRSILVVICFNFYIQGMRNVLNTFKEASGIFYEDRYIPLIESLVNLFLSLILVNVIGLAGVLLATIISTLVVYIYSYPKYVYKMIFKKNIYIYLREQIYYFGFMIVVFALTLGITKIFRFNNTLLHFIINIFICIFVPNIIYFIAFNRKGEFQYFKSLFFTLIRKRVSM